MEKSFGILWRESSVFRNGVLVIFAVVGLHGVGFNRFVKLIDDLASKTKEDIIIQIGAATYTPSYADYFVFGDIWKMSDHYRNSDIVITHGGVGSIMSALSHNKPIIVVPRLQKYGEVTDDHQLEIANAFCQLGFVSVANDFNELKKAIIAIRTGEVKVVTYPFSSGQSKIVTYLKSYLDVLNLKR